jgi:peptidoglycan hydrolase-like protein with peptidoglycan-binding domain
MREETAVKPTLQPFAPAATGLLQRKCACGQHATDQHGQCTECKKKGQLLQRRAVNQNGPAVAPPIVHEVLRSPGRPLDPATRAYMESRFGHDFSQVQTTAATVARAGLAIGPTNDRAEREADRLSHQVMRASAPAGPTGTARSSRHNFSDVRVHTDDRAAESARVVNALAYTVGNHVIFAKRQYAPMTTAGRRLLAHELIHTIQQAGSVTAVQRACDPTLPPLAARTNPVFFPRQARLMDVFRGLRTLTPSLAPKPEVGLVQQALVDLGLNLGTSGPNGDGVDEKFGSDTTTAVTSFQTSEAIPGVTPGVIDQPTLKCLDDKRAQVAVPPHQAGVVTPGQVQIGGETTGGRDEDIFFARGSSTLDAGDKAKIGRLLSRAVNPLKGCPITLEGFVSEDELVEFGPSLATDRINAVDAEFVTRNHDDPGPACPLPTLPLRTHSPLPTASSGVSAYQSRRKVEVVPAGAISTTAPCPPGSPQHRALTGPESTVLTDGINLAAGWMNTAIGELTPGDPEGDAALTAYFGGTARRSTIKTNLTTWRDHLDTVVRVNNRHGTQCNATCRTAIAFNQGTGPAAQMTVCPPFFQPLTIHPVLNQDEKKAFVMMHEAGHGSIGTRDTGYGHRRLIEFLAGFPAIAETNTDSYTLMVLCLNGFAGFCAAPSTTDSAPGLSGPEALKTRRGVAWLQTWLTWAQQDTSSLYGRMNIARQSGQGLRAVNTYYADVYGVLVSAFNVRRPPGDPPPTFGEQTMVAAVLDRVLTMARATAAGLTVEKDTSAVPVPRWAVGPGRRLFLTDAYFLLTTDRERVQHLLPLIIRANTQISSALEPMYETYINENVRRNRGDKP